MRFPCRNFAAKLLLFSVVLIACLVLADFLLRIILPIYDPQGALTYQYYPEDGLTLCRKNFSGRQWKNSGDYNVKVNINKYGLRDKKDIAASSADALFVVGDSFVFGWGVEEPQRYADLLVTMLRRPVYNLGLPAADIEDYRKVVAYAQGKGAKIKNLILSVCMENDLRSYRTLAPKRSMPRGRAPKRYRYNTARIIPEIKAWLAQNSSIYLALSTLVQQNLILRNIAQKYGLIADNYANMYGGSNYPDAILVSSSEKILKVTRPFNSVIVIVPSRGLWKGDNRDVELAKHNKLVSLLKEGGARVVDMRPYFEEGGDPLQYHFKNDPHWNAKGHLKAAQAISDYIIQNRILYNTTGN